MVAKCNGKVERNKKMNQTCQPFPEALLCCWSTPGIRFMYAITLIGMSTQTKNECIAEYLISRKIVDPLLIKTAQDYFSQDVMTIFTEWKS